MELSWPAAAVAGAIAAVAWRHGVGGAACSLIQGLAVLYAATAASAGYLALRAHLGREPGAAEKFWVALPLFASLSVAGRCVFGRLARVAVRARRRPPAKENS